MYESCIQQKYSSGSSGSFQNLFDLRRGQWTLKLCEVSMWGYFSHMKQQIHVSFDHIIQVYEQA